MKKAILAVSLLFIFCASACAFVPPEYDITARIDSKEHRIHAVQKVTFTNNYGRPLTELCFHIYPHRSYSREDVKKLYRYAGYFKVNPFPEGFQSGDLRLLSARTPEGSPLEFTAGGDDASILSVKLKRPLVKGEAVSVELEYAVDIPHSYGKFGWHKEIISLLRWYPILSSYNEQGWHNYPFYIFHQPYYSDASMYKAQITLAADVKIACSGSIVREERLPGGEKKLFIQARQPLRDFGMVLSEDFQVISQDEQGVRINVFYLSGDGQKARQAAEYAAGLIRFYAGKFGAYPYAEFNIAQSYLAYGGCQSSGLILLDTRIFRLPGLLDRYLDFLVSHETGHQWFYNIIGSDEFREMFLDEGFNSYWIIEHLENKYGPSAAVMQLPKYLRPFIPNFTFRDTSYSRYLYMAKNGLDRPVVGELSGFNEPSSIFALAYGKGASLLSMLKGQVGDKVFAAIMERYAQDYRFANADLKGFIRICNELSAKDMSEFFRQWLEAPGTCDYAVSKAGADGVVLRRLGEVVMPEEAVVTFRDAATKVYSWDGIDKRHVLDTQGKRVKSVELDPGKKVLLDLDRTNNFWPRKLNLRPVVLYYPAYELAPVQDRDAYNLAAGPSCGGSSLGLASSLAKPYDITARLSSTYDFSGHSFDNKAGLEAAHLFSKQMGAGVEFARSDARGREDDITSAKIYLRRELWPASYGLLDRNDHVSLYLLKNRKIGSTAQIGGQENSQGLFYKRRDEAVIGVSGDFGRYGPYPDPVNGWKISPLQEVAGHFMGGDYFFWRTRVEADKYWLVVPRKQHVLALKLEPGIGGPSERVLFQPGGPDGLRGYDRKPIEGCAQMLGSLEYRMPVASDLKLYFLDNLINLEKIQLVGFFDAANVWGRKLSSSGLKKDVGLGLRLHMGFCGFLEKAVLRLDVAKAIDDKEDAHVWFGVNQAF